MTAPLMSQYYSDRKTLFPLDSSDPDLFLDLDFTVIQSQAALDAILVTTQGLTKTGGPATFHPTNGINPGQSLWYNNSDWTPSGMASRADIGERFTIYYEVRRADISSTWKDNSTGFLDNGVGPSIDDPYADGYLAYVFSLEKNGSPFPFIVSYWSQVSGPAGRFVLAHKDTAAQGGITLSWEPYEISVDGFEMDDFVKVAIVFDRFQLEFYIDGVCVKTYTRTTLPGSTGDDLCQRLRLFGVSGSLFKGWIRRFQLIKRAVHNMHAVGPRIAVYGDSYVVNGAQTAVPTGTTTTALNAIQNLTTDNTLPSITSTLNPISTGNPNAYLWALRKVSANYGLRTRMFVAGMASHGWSKSVATHGATCTFSGSTVTYSGADIFTDGETIIFTTTGALPAEVVAGTEYYIRSLNTGANTFAISATSQGSAISFSGAGTGTHTGTAQSEIAQFYRDGVIAYNPEIILAQASVNDVNISGAPDTTLATDMAATLDEFIDGCPNLRKILLTNIFPFYGSSTANGAAGRAEYARINAIVNTFDGYRDRVELVDVYNHFGGDDCDAALSRGGSPYAPLWDALYTKSLANNDIHPGQYGHQKITEALWPQFKAAVFSLPDVSQL